MCAHEIKTKRHISLGHIYFFWQVLKLLARAALTSNDVSAPRPWAPTLGAAVSQLLTHAAMMGAAPQQDPVTRHPNQPSALLFRLDFRVFFPSPLHSSKQAHIKCVEMWQQQSKETQECRDCEHRGERRAPRWPLQVTLWWKQPEPAQEKHLKWQVYRKKKVIKDYYFAKIYCNWNTVT